MVHGIGEMQEINLALNAETLGDVSEELLAK